MCDFPAGLNPTRLVPLCLGIALIFGSTARAEVPTPVLHTIYPAGGQAGTEINVTLEGSALEGLTGLRFHDPKITSKKGTGNQYSISIPEGTLPGTYDVRAMTPQGISSSRLFVIGNRKELVETEPNDGLEKPESVPLNSTINGRVEKPGDLDCFQFTATAGQRVILECWAERIDSKLRAVIELYDAQGKRLAANRGYTGIDPLIDFFVPADGVYTIKIFDLTFTGSSHHFYRLDIDTGPRVEFAVPSVIQRGKTTRVAFYGRNLVERKPGQVDASVSTPLFDRIERDVTPPETLPEQTGLRLKPAQMAADVFSYYCAGSHTPVLLSLTDVTVIPEEPGNHSPGNPQQIVFPCEVSGQLIAGDEQDWFSLQASRGDVLWIEAFGERIGSPVDLDVVVLDASGERELAHFTDCVTNLGGNRFPLNHLDPAGRWVAPADGKYVIMIRNLIGDLTQDPRRTYRLSVRREEPDFHLAVVSRRNDQPSGLNIARGGREMLEVFAVRQRGMNGAIRVTAKDLPAGIECPEIWLGPGVDRAPLVFTTSNDTLVINGKLTLSGRADIGGTEVVRGVAGGTMVWPNQPTGSGRMAEDVLVATTNAAPLLLTATPNEVVVDQDSVVCIAVELARRVEGHGVPTNLSATGLPSLIGEQVATISPDEDKAWISFHMPPSLPAGKYTFAIQGETKVPVYAGSPAKKTGEIPVTIISNPITVRVRPAHVSVSIDPRTPRKIARGKIIQLGFAVERKNGFIGKTHVELMAPGGVMGLRGRGVTLTSQSDSGTIQIIATDDAPLGRQAFLYIEAVGTVEDKPVYHASRFLELEITE